MTVLAKLDPRKGGPVGRVLAERHLWSVVPRPRPAPPGGVRRAVVSFDLDYTGDTLRLDALRALLAEEECPATIFAIGALVDQEPGPYARAAEAGLEMGNHTQTHPDNPVLCPDEEFWDLDVARMTEEIGRCQDAVERATGARPRAFRTPHFKDHPRMLAALAASPEIDIVSTTLSSRSPRVVPYAPARTEVAGRYSLNFPADAGDEAGSPVMVPLSPCPGLRWSPFCSYASIRRPSDPSKGAGLHTPEEWVGLWSDLLARDRDIGFVSAYFDPIDVMRDAKTVAAFRSILRAARETGWTLCTVGEAADAWLPKPIHA